MELISKATAKAKLAMLHFEKSVKCCFMWLRTTNRATKVKNSHKYLLYIMVVISNMSGMYVNMQCIQLFP